MPSLEVYFCRCAVCGTKTESCVFAEVDKAEHCRLYRGGGSVHTYSFLPFVFLQQRGYWQRDLRGISLQDREGILGQRGPGPLKADEISLLSSITQIASGCTDSLVHRLDFTMGKPRVSSQPDIDTSHLKFGERVHDLICAPSSSFSYDMLNLKATKIERSTRLSQTIAFALRQKGINKPLKQAASSEHFSALMIPFTFSLRLTGVHARPLKASYLP